MFFIWNGFHATIVVLLGGVNGTNLHGNNNFTEHADWFMFVISECHSTLTYGVHRNCNLL